MKALSLFIALTLANTSAHTAMEADGHDLLAGDKAIAIRAPTVACTSAEYERLNALRIKMVKLDFTDAGIAKAEVTVARRASRTECIFFRAGTVLIVNEMNQDRVCVRAEVPGVTPRAGTNPGCLFTHAGSVDPWPARLTIEE